MKKGFAVLLIAALLCAAIPTALAETWYCPQCGNQNYYNFCPMCGTAKPVYPSSPTGGWNSNYTDYAYDMRVFEKSLHVSVFSFTSPSETGFFFGLYSNTR